jgi:hypothetical protein
MIGKDHLTCFNLQGIDRAGLPFNKVVPVKKGRLQPLWFGIELPKDAAGIYQAQLTIKPAGMAPTTVTVKLKVSGALLCPARHTFQHNSLL